MSDNKEIMTDEFVTEKKEIEKLGLGALKDFFKLDVTAIEPEVIKMIHNKARIAMQFEREMNISRRAIEMNYIRVFRMIAEDKSELKRYIKKSLPQYYPMK